MIKKGQIQIDQALHGYLDGHRLLASSTALTRTTERTMLALSDMSGPSKVSGFEEYITGYPLPNEKIYALAKTWYAPEMKRPGCVWTHTLLIKSTYLSEIPNLSAICKLFKQPHGKPVKHMYEKTVSLNISHETHEFLGNGSSNYPDTLYEVDSLEHLVGHIIFNLYGDKDCPVVLLPATKSSIYEKLVFNLWSQQWADLRRSFAFCTGSLSNRSHEGREFDLQIIPSKAILEFEREAPRAKILKVEKVQSRSPHTKWVSTATKDLLDYESGRLRSYLWEVGDVSNTKRFLYASLVKIYDCLAAANSSEMTINELLSELAKSFPRPEDGKLLKKRIFGPFTKKQRSLLEYFDEPRLLWALALTSHQSIFSPDKLEIRSRASSLWREGSDQFHDIIIELIETDINPLGEEILVGIAEVVEPDELLKVSRIHPGMLFVFVERRPALASYKDFWTKSLDYQRELLDHLAKGLLKEETVNNIVKAMLDAGSDGIGDDAHKRLGKSVVKALLKWFDEQASKKKEKLSLGARWKGVLKKAPDDTLQWLANAAKPNTKTVALIASQLDPHASTTRKFGTQVWLRLLETVGSDLDPRTHKTLAEFLLPFSLNKPGPGYDKLARFSFDAIHDALARDDLSYDSWRRLEPVLPKLPWYRSWDKCERLRRGVKQIGLHVHQ